MRRSLYNESMFDVDDRPDYMRHRGRAATISVGPFRFHVNTSDEGLIGFEIILGAWSWGWSFQGEQS